MTTKGDLRWRDRRSLRCPGPKTPACAGCSTQGDCAPIPGNFSFHRRNSLMIILLDILPEYVLYWMVQKGKERRLETNEVLPPIFRDPFDSLSRCCRSFWPDLQADESLCVSGSNREPAVGALRGRTTFINGFSPSQLSPLSCHTRRASSPPVWPYVQSSRLSRSLPVLPHEKPF
jgi:hypothetical protein